jgi:hypothetical protein
MLEHLSFNFRTEREAARMVQNSSVLTTVEHSSQVCHLSCHPEQSVIFHIWLAHGEVLEVNSIYEYKQSIVFVQCKNVMLLARFQASAMV